MRLPWGFFFENSNFLRLAIFLCWKYTSSYFMSYNALQKCLKGNLQKTMLCIGLCFSKLQQCLPQLLFLCIIIDLEMTNKGFIVYIIDRMTSVADSVFEIFLSFQKSLEIFLFEFSRQKRPKLHSLMNHITLQLFEFSRQKLALV